MRRTWGSRLLAGALLAGLLFGMVVPGAAAVGSSRYATYADWLRSQAHGPVDEAFEEALEHAVAARPETLSEFLRAFVDGFESGERDGGIAGAFAAGDLTDDALITHLQSRYQRVGCQGMAPRPVVKTAVLHATQPVDNPGTGTTHITASVVTMPVTAEDAVVALPLAILQQQILSSARPMGP